MTDTPPAADSVLKGLNQVNQRLDRLLDNLGAQAGADAALRQLARELVLAVARAPDIALASILLNQIAGRYAVRHCVETAIVGALIARAMGQPEPEVVTVAAAALTMNVGMMREIESFQSRQGALSHEERALIRRHPGASAQMLRYAGVDDEDWLACVLLHHEKSDGSGYPEGRREADIPLNARLIAAADRYCACVSARNYRRSMLPPLALETLAQEADGAADLALTRHFAERIGPYPPGTLVRLVNGEIGVMTGRAAVHALRGADGAAIGLVRDSAEPACAVQEALHEDQARLRFSMKNVWGELASLV